MTVPSCLSETLNKYNTLKIKSYEHGMCAGARKKKNLKGFPFYNLQARATH